MKTLIARKAVRFVGAALLLTGIIVTHSNAQEKVPLDLQLPAPTVKGTPPAEMPTGPHIDAYSTNPAPAFLIVKGVKNVALGKPAATSVNPMSETQPEAITDGKKEPVDIDTVEMKGGTQWAQVDLGESFAIQAIALWHDHRYIQLMHDVIVQVSDDPQFKTGVTTLFNNDTDNSSGLGVGTDREYFETRYGRVIDGKATKARYIRGYTKGNNQSGLNYWQEIEVYVLPNP